jgi:Cys-tRNA(Pro) deacylase
LYSQRLPVSYIGGEILLPGCGGVRIRYNGSDRKNRPGREEYARARGNHSFEESTHNSELAARTLGVEVGQIAKTILLLVDDSPLVVVISGDLRVDLKKVKAMRNGRKVRLAGPEDLVEHTGFKVGAVSPLALPDGIPIYLDASLNRFGTIYPSAGETNNMFETTPAELAALTGGTESDLAR